MNRSEALVIVAGSRSRPAEATAACAWRKGRGLVGIEAAVISGFGPDFPRARRAARGLSGLPVRRLSVHRSNEFLGRPAERAAWGADGGEPQHRWRIGALAASCSWPRSFSSSGRSSAQAIAQGQTGATYVGVASCGGTTCHGRSEGDGPVVRQDEMMLWQDPSSPAGAHSRAYAVLREPRSQAIAAAARHRRGGERADVPRLPRHAAPGRAAPASSRRDGVGCESCHGAASGWLSSHYAVGGTHANNVSRGLVPLENPRARAAVCLDCHFGSADARPVRQPPDHGRRPSAHLVRARPVHDPPAASQGGCRLSPAQGPVGLGPDVGGRPGDGAGALADPVRQPGARHRGHLPRILFLRLPQLPPADLRRPALPAERGRQSRPADPVRHAALQ